ncbi:MAG: XRE family transcriptional regulator [Alphaproteobacteria bacterium]
MVEFVKGSGNIFRDLGHANRDIELMKATLAAEIIRVLDTRKLGVRKAGEIAQVQYADISRVRNTNLNKFTVDWLAKVFSRLEPKVEMRLRFSERSFGTLCDAEVSKE